MGFLGVQGVSQDMQMCVGLDLTQHLALNITSISAAQGHEARKMWWSQGWRQAQEDEEGTGDTAVLKYLTPWGAS